MVSMGDGGVACVQNFMEHFNSSEPFCGNHGFEKNKNSAKLPDDDQQVADNLQRNKGEWSNRAEFQCENANNNDGIGTSRAEIHVSECGNGNSTDVIAAKITSTSYSDGGMAAAEPVDRPRRSSRWDVTEESNGWDSRIRENGSGVGLRRHDDEERHKEVELGLGQDSAGREHIGNHQAEKVLGVDGRLKRRGIVSDDVHSRLGHFESPSCRNSNERYSNDRYPGYYKSNSSSRGPYERHSRHFEPSSSSRHGHERYSSRRSGSADRGGYCERSSYENRRCQYEDRNGYKKNSAEKYYGRYSSSQAYDDRKYHRKEVDWRESRRHSNHRQSHSGWDRLVDDSRQSDGRQPHSGWADRIMDDNRQYDGRQSHSVWGDRILDDNRQSESRQSHSGRGSQVLDDGKGRISSSWGNHGRSSYSSLTKDSRSSKDVEAQLSASPAQTPASDRSERFHDEVRSEGNSAHLSEQYILSEPPKHEEPICSGWVYIDHLGIEQGPLKLVELRTLVEDGQLQSDHLIKREGSDKWVTIENAASPMPFGKLSLLTSKFLPQAQNDPVSNTSTNKPGMVANSLKIIHEMPNCDSTLSVLQDNPSNVLLEDLHIDERVEKLMQGFPLIPGRENEIVSEALRHAARHVNHSLEHYAECEGSPGLRDGYDIYCNRWRDAELGRGFENESNVSKIAITSGGALKKDLDYDKGVSTGTGILFRGEGYSQFSGRWPSKGGDWKQIGENVGGGDRFLRKKVVLNDGVPLCEILKSGVVDPRKSLQEASCYATHCKRLELPPWAYHWQEEKTDPLHKIDNALEVHLQSGHGSIATPKAHASTSKFQVCTPGSQISTPRGTVVSHGHDGLKTTRTNNGELSKSLIGNKSNQHVSSTAKVSNIGKAASSFQCEMKSVVKSNAAIFKDSVPLCANSQNLEHSTVKVEQVPDQPLHCDLPAEAVRVSPSRIHVSNLPQVTEAEAARPNEVVSSVHVRTVNDLKLDMGEWYFRDGAGHEKGPLTFTQLQMLVSGGTLQKNSSVYRKSDNTWVPIYHQVSATLNSSEKALIEDSPCRPPGTASPAYKDPEQHELENYIPNQAAFHALYPHFVGYARGKLHEHVMKSYRSRDFAAAIGEVLDAWLNPKQSKNSKDTRLPSHLISRPISLIDSAGNKDNGVNLQNSEGKLDGNLKSSTTCQRSSNHNFSCSGLSISESEKGSTLSRFESELADSHSHGKNQDTSKRHRLQVIQDVDKRDIARSELQADFYIDRSCGDLVQEATSHLEENSNTQTKMHGSMLNPRILERVFHFLGDDLKSIASSAATCKCWNSVIRLLKSKSRRLDFSSLGPVCNDAVFQSIMGGYGEGKIKHLVLKGCTNLSADALMHFLRGCSSIVSIDIAGCNQFKDVARVFCKVKWQRSRIPGPTSSGDQSEETHYKVKSLKQINDKIYGSCRSSRALDIYTSDDSAGRDMLMPPHEADQGEPMDVDDFHVDSKVTGSPVRQRAYLAKRLKLNSSGKSAKIQMEDGSLKGESSGKSSTGYCAGGDKIIERHLSATLKDILNVNTNNFFLHRASEIEQKIKAGSYTGDMQGINSFGNDLFLICRKAFQEHKKGSRGHITAEEIFKVAHRHFKNLKDKFEKVFSGDMNHQKSAHGNDMIPRPGKDKSQSLYTTSSNIKKRYRRGMAVAVKRNKRRRGMSNSDCSDFIEEDMSDRERRLLKQKKRHWSDSETETSESSSFLEEEFQEKDDKNDMDDSDLDMKFDSEGEDGGCYEQKYAMEEELEISVREWGARMTTESLVPPVTRKYEVIDEYVIVADEAEVSRKMKVCLPLDYEEKLRAAKDKRDNNYAHLEIPELKDYRPRKQLGDEVLEQEVYGIDPYTHNLIFDTMPKGSEFSLEERHAIIEEVLLRVLNESVRDYTGTGKTPMEYPLQDVVQRMMVNAEKSGDICKQTFFQGLLKTMQSRQSTEKYVAYRKGLGVVCNKEDGFEKDDFVVEFLGEVYPAWRWYEKQDGIRSFQKKDKDPAPEFYNIALERPKSDGAGYDLVVVDAMHKANYASRICHSCRPNCEAKVTAVDGQYQIGLYTLRPIQYGEEITFDYNSLTESKEEYEASVCLCGTSCCRGSYLNLAGAGAYQKVLKECHSLLNRHHLLLEACTTNSVTQKDWIDLRAAGVWTCLLSGLPAWAIAYAAHVVRFMNLERSRLPDQILKHIRKEKRKAGIEISYECDERGEAEVQADGFYNQRLHNLAITLDKARYIITKLHKDPTKAPPPLRKIEATELVSLLWKDEDSLVEELLRCMTNHVERERLNHLKEQVHMRELSGSRNLEKSLRESLLWLRDELRNMPSICRCGHDAAADLIHLYAYTKCFFKSLDYGPLESPPLCISPLDLGPKYADSLGAGFKEWQKTYGKDYALGQLIYWFKQTAPDPGANLNKARRGVLVLPDISSCYAKAHRQDVSRGYGLKEHTELIRRMEREPQKPWPKGEFWEFKNNRGLYGSPMFDAVMNNSPLDKEMMQWLRNPHVLFEGPLYH